MDRDSTGTEPNRTTPSRTSSPPNFGTNPCGPCAPRNVPSLRVPSNPRIFASPRDPLLLLMSRRPPLVFCPPTVACLFSVFSAVLAGNNQFDELAALDPDYLPIAAGTTTEFLPGPSSCWPEPVAAAGRGVWGQTAEEEQVSNEMSLFGNKSLTVFELWAAQMRSFPAAMAFSSDAAGPSCGTSFKSAKLGSSLQPLSGRNKSGWDSYSKSWMWFSWCSS